MLFISKPGEEGFVLVPAVWLAGLIGIALSVFLTEIRIDTKAAANLVDNARAEFLADGLVRLVAFGLAMDDGKEWADVGGLCKCQLNAEYSALWKVQDQSGLVDLNAASGLTLRELGRRLGLTASSAQSIADKILDFRDLDDSSQPNGAEIDDYRAAGLKQGPKNRPFDHVSELDQLLGMSEELFKLLVGSVTIYSGQDGIDPAVAADQLQQSSESKFPLVMSQRQSFAIDALVSKKDGTGFFRRAIIRVLRRPDKPFAIVEWEIGNADDAAKLLEASPQECPLSHGSAAIP